jgi:predicted kinase
MLGRASTMTRDGVSARGSVVMMCGLPASGTTTTAESLHGYTGGVLIRSCDVYKELGISLPDWVRRTAGFTRDVTAYEQVRDAAYARMLSLVKEHLTAGSRFVIVDAVHGESVKRRAVFDVCAAHEADPLLLWCRCEDRSVIERRLGMRRGREAEPEREASDWSVFEHLTRLWEAPFHERSQSSAVPILSYDTWLGRLRWLCRARRPVSQLIENALRQGVLDRL